MDKYGAGERPPLGVEPTLAHLTCIQTVLKSGECPYVVLAVWVAYANRGVKSHRLTGKQIMQDGTLGELLMLGPANFDLWLQSWRVFRTAMILLSSADMGVLDRCERMITHFNAMRGGHGTWPLLYQAENRACCELRPHICRQWPPILTWDPMQTDHGTNAYTSWFSLCNGGKSNSYNQSAR